jgi:glycosyltransferase involved in cell wall biosynthesis
VSVVLPTLNEKDSIRRHIQQLYELGVVDEVVVVNNNAAAGTSEEVAQTPAREVHEPSQGYGHSVRRGLAEAKGDIVILSEPDGTFLARDVLKLLAFEEDFDVVLGSRTIHELIWEGANMGFFLRTGNWVVAKLMQVLFNTPSLSDVGCTMRLMSRRALDRMLPTFRVGGSHFSVEFMLASALSGFAVVQVPVNYLPRVGVSSATGKTTVAIRVGLQMIAFILRRRLQTMFSPRPRRQPRTLSLQSSERELF